MKKSILSITVISIVLIVILSGCAEVSPMAKQCVTSDPYGFWGGLWHGMILPFSWICSLFNDHIALFAYNNNGAWYNFGFALGCGAILGGGTKAISK